MPLILYSCVTVYVGLRDKHGISRIGFVDLSKKNPSEVVTISKVPLLDIGEGGSFDQNSVVPSVLFNMNNDLFYANYQLGAKVRFSVLGGNPYNCL